MGDFLSEAGKLVPNIDVGFVASMLSDVFGVNSPIYFPYILGSEFKPKEYKLPEDYSGYNPALDETYDRLSVFGTPVFGSFTIAGGTYKVFDKRSGKLIDKTFMEFEFPVATLIEFKRPKTISKTPTIGSAGSVKEIFGFEDWQISIKGICLNDPSRWGTVNASEQKLRLIELNEIAGSLEISQEKAGKIFHEKGISRIVFEDLSIGAIQGKPNMIPFEITATSDEDILITGL